MKNTTYVLDGFRFPTTRELEKTSSILLEGTNPDSFFRSFFPDNPTLSHEIEMYTSSEWGSGMTYFHALASEPRPFTIGNAAAKKTSWTGAYFKEFARWGEIEILKLGELKDDVRSTKITDEVARALVEMDKRINRRLEWLCAQVITKGSIAVTANMADNPEQLEYTVDFRIRSKDVALAAADKWNNLDGGGLNTADPVKYFHDLTVANIDDARNLGRYQVQTILMNTITYRELAKNTKIVERYRLSLGGGYLNALDPIAILPQFPGIFKALTGIDIQVYDGGYLDNNKVFQKYIPNGLVIALYSGTGTFGEFTYTTHAHTEGDKIAVGTGRFLVADSQLEKANPYYQIFHGFHGLPRLLDYDEEFENQRIKFFTVL